VTVRDQKTGERITLFNTHVSSHGRQTEPQVAQVLEIAKHAPTEKVLLMGDMNTATADTDRKHDPRWARTRARMQEAGFQDMGPQGANGISLRSHGINIDYVLAKGFHSQGGHMWKGDDIGLGTDLPNAESISDHYAEEDTLDYDR
jgi:endonuclease/exonuclease/phosphatase family metal-dependent hydrolase